MLVDQAFETVMVNLILDNEQLDNTTVGTCLLKGF